MEAGRTLDGAPLPIDLEHLSRYTAAHPETTREVLIIFRDQARTWMSRMSPGGDLDVWAASAHTLKGAAKAIGAWPVAELCERAEALGEQTTAASETARREVLAQLRAEVDRACRYIDQVIEPLAG